MKKQNKIILLSILSCLIAFITSCSFTHNTKIKTKFGDEFIVSSDSWTDSYYIKDVNSDFCLSISYFEDENDFKPICDTKLFRCYRLKNSIDDIYICKLKKETSFFWIGAEVNEEVIQAAEQAAEKAEEVINEAQTAQEVFEEAAREQQQEQQKTEEVQETVVEQSQDPLTTAYNKKEQA